MSTVGGIYTCSYSWSVLSVPVWLMLNIWKASTGFYILYSFFYESNYKRPSVLKGDIEFGGIWFLLFYIQPHTFNNNFTCCVFLCFFCDIQSHGTSIAVWSETSITGFVLHAYKAHCPEMSVLPLICVSTHMMLWQYRTALVANGVGAQQLKTNPSNRKKMAKERKERRERAT